MYARSLVWCSTLALVPLTPAPARAAGDGAVAEQFAEAISADPPPGLIRAVHVIGLPCGGVSEWFAIVGDSAVRSLQQTCWVIGRSGVCGHEAPAHEWEISAGHGEDICRSAGYWPSSSPVPESGLAQSLAAFFDRMPAAASTTVFIERYVIPSMGAFLVTSGTPPSERMVLQVGARWLAAPDAFEPPEPVRPLALNPRWFITATRSPDKALLFTYLSDYEEGTGNNTVGGIGVSARVLLVRQGQLELGPSLDLGGGTWGRRVDDGGFHHSYTNDVLCPSLWKGGIALKPACPFDTDPRYRSSLSELEHTSVLATACSSRCPGPRISKTARAAAGFYLATGEGFRKARGRRLLDGARVRRGMLDIVERPLGTEWLEPVRFFELTNRTNDIISLDGVWLSNREGFGSPRQYPISDCVLDAGETAFVPLSLIYELNEPQPPAMQLCSLMGLSLLRTDDDIELRTSAGVIASSPSQSSAELKQLRGREDLSRQVDARGRTCVLPATPGQPNPPCK